MEMRRIYYSLLSLFMYNYTIYSQISRLQTAEIVDGKCLLITDTYTYMYKYVYTYMHIYFIVYTVLYLCI